MVHSSQVSDELSLSREDDDEMKIKAMDWVAPAGSQVRAFTLMLSKCAHGVMAFHRCTNKMCASGVDQGDRDQGRWQRRLQASMQHEGVPLLFELYFVALHLKVSSCKVTIYIGTTTLPSRSNCFYLPTPAVGSLWLA